MYDDHDLFFHNYNNNIRDIPIQKGQFGDNYDNAYIQLYWYSAHRAGKTILIISSFFFTGGGGICMIEKICENNWYTLLFSFAFLFLLFNLLFSSFLSN